MKKLSLFAATILLGSFAFAQVQIGPVAGLNFAMFRYSETKDHNTLRLGYSIGLKATSNFGKIFSFQPAIIWNNIGGKLKDGDNASTQSVNYISVPLNVALRLGDEEGGQFQVFLGPYIGYGISGTNTFKIGGNENSNDIDFGTDDDEFRPFDVGANVGIGYKTGHILVNLGYSMGFANLSNSKGTGSSKINNSVVSLNVAYLLGKSKE